MKHLILIILLIPLTFGCNSGKTEKTQTPISVKEVITLADEKVDQELVITGTVNHVCSHSGRRCFLIDDTGEHSIRVEAAGEIENFEKELIGKNIRVTGILKEDRFTAAEIDKLESDYLTKHPEEVNNDGEHCSAELANINEMREWMKEHGKNYYAIYFIEGKSYEIPQ